MHVDPESLLLGGVITSFVIVTVAAVEEFLIGRVK